MKRFNDSLINLLNRFLSSTMGLYVALILPLAVIPMPDKVRQIENILSSNWTQLWALFVLAIIAKRTLDRADAHHAEHMEHIRKVHKHLGIREDQ